ncbi:uncharacterized protein LOC106536286 [Austrofundulus limnaeus]|uniref:Uncharacterized protein LOC106536286 n=1 Tax=Austrofundulus limnaeus TaxID=52670 RepID=A0A2I4D9N4_AUSLI|nr:PREDICTED: uncharacterized protein LOC106536286 [Austrofundulus limnaeus]
MRIRTFPQEDRTETDSVEQVIDSRCVFKDRVRVTSTSSLQIQQIRSSSLQIQQIRSSSLQIQQIRTSSLQIQQPSNSQEPNMSNFITELQVSLTEEEAIPLQNSGYIKIPHALNQGTKGNIYLWYKKGSGTPVTRVQFSFDGNTSKGLNDAGFIKIDKNLGVGTGNEIYVWYSNESTEAKLPAITDIKITSAKDADDAAFKLTSGWDAPDAAYKMASGWEPVSSELYWWWCLSKTWILLWVKKEEKTYVKKIIATNHFDNDHQLFKDGYTRLDQNTNRGAKEAKPVFIWCLSTTDPAEAIRDLSVSTNDDQVHNLQAQHFQEVIPDLNEGTGGDKVHLWYKKDDSKTPIMSVTSICNLENVGPFVSAGAIVIEENLNSGNESGEKMLLVFYPEPAN